MFLYLLLYSSAVFAGGGSVLWDNDPPALYNTAWTTFLANSSPVAVTDTTNVTEDIPATGNVLTNDSDPEGDALTASLVTAPVNGTVVLNADGSFTYTPNSNYTGMDSLIYQVCDNGRPSLCDTATLIFIISQINDAPTAVQDSVTVPEDTPTPGDVLTNDSDPDAGDVLGTYMVVEPVNGTVVMNQDGSIIYTPNTNYTGLDSMTYQLCDNGVPSLCDTATIIFTVIPVNDPPAAARDTTNVSEDIPATGNVLTNDSDPEGNALTASLVTAPVNGTVVLNADGSFIYTPNADYNGVDSLIYQVCDNGAPSFCDTATLTFIISEANDPPVAVQDSVTVSEDIPVTGNVLTNDSDPDGGDTLLVSLVTGPANGSLALNAGGGFTYTPDAGYSGLDSMVYRLCDYGGLCDTATVIFNIVAVNDAPVAARDTTNVTEDIPATGNVLTNDSDPEGNALTASLVTAPVNGTVVLNADGSFTYTPNADYAGTDSLIYQVCDNGTPSLCDTTILILNISQTNDAPIAVQDSVRVSENTPATGKVLTNDSDPEGNALTALLVTAPMNGTVVLNGDGSLTYTPNAGYNGIDSLIYQVCDNGIPSLCDTATVIFNIAAVNDAPVAVRDTTNVTEDTPATGNVLTNDSDAEGNALTASLVTAPVNGTVVLNGDGSFTYTPNADHAGTDSLIYQVCDNGRPSLCDTATVIFTITAVNDAPLAVRDSVSLSEDIPATGNILTNDSDPEGETLTATLVTAPVNGTAVLNPDGSFTYTPNTDYAGTDSMTYRVCDPQGLCDTANVFFSITAVNDAPVAVPDSVNTSENTPITANVLTNDSDPEGGTLTVTLVTAPTNGNVTLNGDGSLTYTPNTDYAGMDSLVYKVCDNGTPALCDTTMVIFNIAYVNRPPAAVPDSITVISGSPVTGNVLTNDADPEGDALTATVVTTSPNGTIQLNADGTFTYTSDTGYTGADSVIYEVCDPQGLCDTTYLFIDVDPVPENPVAGLSKAASTAQLQPDGSYRLTLVFTVKNYGNTNLKNVTVEDDLRNVFTTPAAWTVESVTASGTLVANTAYNGGSDIHLLQSLSTLDMDAQDSITLTLRVTANGNFGPFTNAAVLNAQSINENVPVTDISNDGREPDTDGDSIPNEASDNVPTQITFIANPVIGIAKSVSTPRLEIDGSYTFTYSFYIRNMGNASLEQVRLTDDLQSVLPLPLAYRVVGNITATGTLVPNQDFNGSADIALLNPTASTLAVNREDTVQLVINVQPNRQSGTFNNTATTVARATGTALDVTDVSTNGNLADPDDNGVPDEQDATPVVLAPTKLRIPGGFSPNGDGLNDRFVIGNIGSDKLSFEIFNRWGNSVYRTADYKNDWNGGDLPDGTYYYTIVNISTGERYAGHITLMR